jgi:hypothetical protein
MVKCHVRQPTAWQRKPGGERADAGQVGGLEHAIDRVVHQGIQRRGLGILELDYPAAHDHSIQTNQSLWSILKWLRWAGMGAFYRA